MTVNYVAANLYRLGFALDFPLFPEATATLLNSQIIPRTVNTQNYSVDASLQMTMKTAAQQVSFSLDGTGKATIDWGDGTIETYTYTLEEGISRYGYSYSGTSARTITITGENVESPTKSHFYKAYPKSDFPENGAKKLQQAT